MFMIAVPFLVFGFELHCWRSRSQASIRGAAASHLPSWRSHHRAGNATRRLMFLGGWALEGPRYIWWNLVSSRRERIDQAKEEWKSGKFAPVPDDTEFIPLPET
jgi:hypothetical protein